MNKNTGNLLSKEIRLPLVFAFLFLSTLWLNFILYPWPWSSNPINWIFFVRSGGPFLYANHISSEVAMMAVATWYVSRKDEEGNRFQRPMQSLIVVLSIGSMHELFVFFNNVSDYQVFLQANYKYYVEISILLVIAVAIATNSEKKNLAKVALATGSFEVFWLVCINVFGLGAHTIDGFLPGPAFWDWRQNSLEVFSWIIPSAMWVWLAK